MLDRVQVRAVGWQVQYARANGPDRFPHPRDFVGREVVQYDHVAALERWREHLLDIGPEHLAPHGPIQHERSNDPILAQASHEGGGEPVPVRRRIDDALSARRPAITAGHVGSGSGLVEEHEAARIHIALPAPPAAALLRYIGPILLGRSQRLFLRVSPMRRRVR